MSEAALLEVRDLSVRYGQHTVVDRISLSLAPGRCLGIIGESGAGKSQAFLAMMGLSAGAHVDGSVRLADQNLLTNAAQLRGRRVAMIFQDPLTSLTPHLRIGAQIAESLRQHRGMSRREAMQQAAQLLGQVRVNDVPRRLRQYPHELSGGMRQRVMIAIALACDPDLLIADEPTTALDVSVQAQLLALLRQLLAERRIALVVVTHDMGVIAALADEVAVMRGGRIVDSGSVEQILRTPTHEYTRALIAATPRMDEQATPRMDEQATPRMDEQATPRVDQPSTPRSAPPATDVTTLEIRDLAVHHALRAPLLRSLFFRAPVLAAVDGVSLRVMAGQALGLVGESGCGKSSLARAVLRLNPAARGEIVWLGRPIQNLVGRELREIRAGMQMVFQDPLASLDPMQRVADIVAEPLSALRPELTPAQRATRVQEMLARVGLGDGFATRRSRELSGGQCQRVAIARAMVLQPKLLVCDEAVSSLDVSIQAQILTLLAELKREQGTAILFVSHNLAVVRQMCEQVQVMYLGRVVESGPTAEVFRQPRHPYTRLLLDSVPLLDPARERARLAQLGVAGDTPSAVDPPGGCAFHTRCPAALSTCASVRPATEAVAPGHEVACLRWREIQPLAGQ